MCGIIGIVSHQPVNQMLYDGLQLLQHRGQDAAGIVTMDGSMFHMHKNLGMVRDVFRTRDMRNLIGNAGIAHVRYPTAGTASSPAEAQPFYVNSPFGIVLSHNGNLTNTEALQDELFRDDLRHINTSSDSEVLLNVLAHELQRAVEGHSLTPDDVFKAVAGVHRRCRGAYAVVAMIAGFGLLAFRDPHGIRPMVLGRRVDEGGMESIIASESVAIEALGFQLERDVAPGEAILVTSDGRMLSQRCCQVQPFAPCIFEYVYFARPDSIMEGASVYETRLKMGEFLAEKIKRQFGHLRIDVVVPIPDTSRPSALQLAQCLGLPYREGFIKNRYIGRTFIMPGQATRKKSVRQKLNAMPLEFQGKAVLLVDDSIVRGTTSREIIQMARDAGAAAVYFASASPPVRFPNVYGIDMPTRAELLANGRSDEEIAREIGADAVIYQDLRDLIAAVQAVNPTLKRFDASCFDGRYPTADVSEAYLQRLEGQRNGVIPTTPSPPTRQMGLNLAVS
ncbi:MAG TPA: amidophosphoribosyltransferase [Thiobacillaceae bacterium]|nr:amidophosphoribosyltransferase [Thiobacillaceae bacterium]HNU65148.1 amidophosphoribosyltransferase [Thiobacillaceae bacterium]